MKKQTALLAGLFFILVAAATTGEVSEDYIIGPRDILNVVVWGETDMAEKVEVASDGTIPFFYVGKVKVAGLSVSQARDRLVALLADGYIRNPVVILKVEEFHSKEVQIQGAIALPGTYVLTTNDTTLLKLISMAGGAVERRGKWAFVTRGEAWREQERAKAASATPSIGVAAGSTSAPAAGSTSEPVAGSTAVSLTDPAAGSTSQPPTAAPNPSIKTGTPATPILPSSIPAALSYLTPRGSDTTQVVVDLSGLLDRGDYTQDVIIYPGDFVLIGSINVENPAANFVFVGGAVRSPQAIEFTEGMTALQAAIKAGGFTEIASANRATITRTSADGIPVTIRVRLKDIQRGKEADVPLQAGDRINVPESIF